MDRARAERFARDWIEAWNARDFETVLGWYADHLRFTSPTAFVVVGRATVVGKPALRSYWLAALARIESLEFTLDRTLWDPERREIVIVYTSVSNGAAKKVMETFQLGASRSRRRHRGLPRKAPGLTSSCARGAPFSCVGRRRLRTESAR